MKSVVGGGGGGGERGGGGREKKDKTCQFVCFVHRSLISHFTAILYPNLLFV